jgi:hypothetical protein
MSKGAGKQTVTNKLDPQTAAMQGEVFRRAREASTQPLTQYGGQEVAGVDPRTRSAADQYSQGMNLGMGGLSALAGDQGAIANLMNPYQQNVLGALGSEYDRARGQASLGANDDATRGGAFGGDRHALLTGERMGALDRQQMGDTANLLYGGFNDAMGRAGQLANFGMQYGDRSFQAGDYFRNQQQQQYDNSRNNFNEARDWNVRNLDILKGGMTGMPYGTQTSQPLTRNAGAGLLGGAATGAQIGSVIPGVGTAIGAGVGGLLGLL